MSDSDFCMHYVCTHQEAMKLIDNQKQFWVCNCGCRESRGHCSRSRMDVCLMFSSYDGASGSGTREISYAEAGRIMDEAREKQLVSRPFRDMNDKSRTDGICFCCDDCCGYFLNSAEKCDKGTLMEETIMEDCTHCGVCAEVCYFGARKMAAGNLVVDTEKCYGCGLCVDICPEKCITMVPRL